jgi:DNA-binding CsgD family transcriptional regulator
VAALQILDPVDREVLALRFLAGLTEKESAEALGVAVGTVKSRTSRALTRLRMQLEPERETNAERRRVVLAPPVQPREPQRLGGTNTAQEKPVDPAEPLEPVEPLEPIEHLEPVEHREMSRKWTAQ